MVKTLNKLQDLLDGLITACSFNHLLPVHTGLFSTGTDIGCIGTDRQQQIGLDLADALARAHRLGIVHRDVSPQNILLSREGAVKVADFGLARLSGAGEGVNLTQVGMTLGTPLYMSPEQVEGRSLDPRSDIYSLGVVLYQMVTGVCPFVDYEVQIDPATVPAGFEPTTPAPDASNDGNDG